jgi:hypothetical protein
LCICGCKYQVYQADPEVKAQVDTDYLDVSVDEAEMQRDLL